MSSSRRWHPPTNEALPFPPLPEMVPVLSPGGGVGINLPCRGGSLKGVPALTGLGTTSGPVAPGRIWGLDEYFAHPLPK